MLSGARRATGRHWRKSRRGAAGSHWQGDAGGGAGSLAAGGTPTSFDRLIALRFGAVAVRAIAQGQRGVMVALNPPHVNYVPLEEATRRMKTVPLKSDVIQTARDLGICLGDG